MTTMPVSEFKAKCSEVLHAVHERGETVIVTNRGQPLAKIMPLAASAPRRRLGALAGQATELGDIVHGGTESDWESLGWMCPIFRAPLFGPTGPHPLKAPVGAIFE